MACGLPGVDESLADGLREMSILPALVAADEEFGLALDAHRRRLDEEYRAEGGRERPPIEQLLSTDQLAAWFYVRRNGPCSKDAIGEHAFDDSKSNPAVAGLIKRANEKLSDQPDLAFRSTSAGWVIGR